MRSSSFDGPPPPLSCRCEGCTLPAPHAAWSGNALAFSCGHMLCCTSTPLVRHGNRLLLQAQSMQGAYESGVCLASVRDL